MTRIIIAGGSGFIGRALIPHLTARGHEISILTRRMPVPPGARPLLWDGQTPGPWARDLDGAAALVNLAGQNINIPWTAQNRARILSSRTDPIRALAAAMGWCTTPPPLWIQASAIGYYGDTGNHPADESTPAGAGFLADVCREWEATFDAAEVPSRKVTLRIGITLGRGGGPLAVMARLARLGLGGAAGRGRQWMSWIHADDVARIVLFTLDNPSARGPYNAVSPTPTTNADFMRALRRTLRRPWSPPAPALALRAALGPRSSLVLDSTRVVPARLASEGFQWTHPTLDAALAAALQPESMTRDRTA